MANMGFKQGRQGETTLGQRLLVLFLILVIILLSKSLWRISSKYQTSREAKLEAEQAAALVVARHAKLEEQVRLLHTPRGQEEEIRRSLPVAKDGERVVVIIDDQATNTATSNEPTGWWQSLFEF